MQTCSNTNFLHMCTRYISADMKIHYTTVSFLLPTNTARRRGCSSDMRGGLPWLSGVGSCEGPYQYRDIHEFRETTADT